MTPHQLIRTMVNQCEAIVAKQSTYIIVDNALFRGLSELNDATKQTDLGQKKILIEAAGESFALAQRQFQHLDYTNIETAFLEAIKDIGKLLEGLEVKTEVSP